MACPRLILEYLRLFECQLRSGRVHFRQDLDGRPNGEAFVEFVSHEEATCRSIGQTF